MNQFSKIISVATTILALGACDIDESSDVSGEAAQLQIGKTRLEVLGLPAEGLLLAPSAPRSQAAVEKSLDFKEFKEMRASKGRSFSLHANNNIPAEGQLDVVNTFSYVDTCTSDTPLPGGEEGIPSIANVDLITKTFDYVLTFPTFPEIVQSCWYSGPFFSCSIDDQVISFAPFGLDAVVTTTQSRGGLFINSTTMLENHVTSTTCEGADCGLPPASNLLGILKQVPCQKAEVTVYKIQEESA